MLIAICFALFNSTGQGGLDGLDVPARGRAATHFSRSLMNPSLPSASEFRKADNAFSTLSFTKERELEERDLMLWR